MISARPIYHYAHVEFEALTPHGIQAGKGDSTHDVLLMRDPNGLPCIPATSLAGVLRHLYAQHYGIAAENELFGYAEGNQGQPSWVTFTTALVHDSHNKAVEGLRGDIEKDAVLSFLARSKPLVRQRVRLTEKGAAADTGKFDTTLIPAGVRYSAFIGYWSDGSPAAEVSWTQLLNLLSSQSFRLGHGTRAGSGSFKINQLHTNRWDLTTSEGQQGFCQRSRRRVSIKGLVPQQLLPLADKALTIEIALQAEAGWRIGGGETPLSPSNENGRLPDLLPQNEKRISWQHNKAIIEDKIPVMPASAIKGALSHRFAFHYRCLAAEFVNRLETQMLTPNNQCPGVQTVFGYVAEGEQENQDTAQAGLLLIDDLYLESPTVTKQVHNRIDHFTGGIINGALFEEELLWQTQITLKLTVLQAERLDARCKRALERTLHDLAQGWLPLGASGSRGQGTFLGTGAIEYSDAGWSKKDQQFEEQCA
ncbi:RAMP superfamily CRISPR-associated protein [Shewanella oncorhynchi]|uniref:RAMP superfamily CRISPR-associated protein n=1 Tax=Shewanella oncorhynchi TaxID=2726434 RepID=A0AA50Q851_9GAMM|nr:RAMP superfamily CRISPR-associated protein [Shewanella oncorhynchi]WMB74798.1 RAMP superfamily CRISPR-associated protein [Shewanella oncorhynchi]